MLLLTELLAFMYFLLPLLAGLVALRGLLWLVPIRMFWLQRILFRITEPCVDPVRTNFGIKSITWDQAFIATIFILMALWATAVHAGLNFMLLVLANGL